MATTINLNLDGDGVWPDLADKQLVEAAAIHVAALSGGMASGKPSVTIRMDLPDGSVVIGQTSLALFLAAADALVIKYGDPRVADWRPR